MLHIIQNLSNNKPKTKKTPVKRQSQKLEQIRRMENNYHILHDVVQAFSYVEIS